MRYRVLQPMSLPAGQLVGLTDAQAAARAFALRPTADGLWQLLRAVQFKRGETFDAPQPLPKAEAWKCEHAPLPALVTAPRERRKPDSDLPGFGAAAQG